MQRQVEGATSRTAKQTVLVSRKLLISRTVGLSSSLAPGRDASPAHTPRMAGKPDAAGVSRHQENSWGQFGKRPSPPSILPPRVPGA